MSETIERHITRWLNDFVIKHNFCPFAAPVVKNKRLRISVLSHKKNKELVQSVMDELLLLQEIPTEQISTSLLVFEHGLKDFYRYLDFVDIAQAILDELELVGDIQIATFHPDYLFDGEDADGVSHYTNRAPYPMLHLIREDELAEALIKYPDAESIPKRNIEKLNALGIDKINAQLTIINEE